MGLARPILFEAHHICELTLKRLLVQHQQSSRSHKLASLWKQAAPVLPRRVSTIDKAWVDAFLGEMAGLTVDGQDGRFPDATTDISKKWCCLNVPELQLCVGTFLLIMRGGRMQVAVA